MARLSILDLSNNRIHGRISKQESEGWESLSYLDLSDNFLTGLEQHPWTNIQTLDLRSNLLQGPLIAPPPSTQVFMISKNKLSGEFPSSFCNLSGLSVLDLSDNGLSGVIPQCLGNLSNSFSVLDLRNNNFDGNIPGTFALGNYLKYLNLNGNKFEGPLPRSLINCSNLEVLDVGNNNVNDSFPHWLEALAELKVLILHSNSFHGNIGHSKSEFPFSKLQILDLSHNEFTGFLPAKYLSNLKSFMNVAEGNNTQKYLGDGGYYQDLLIVHVSEKGSVIEMNRILTIFTAIDFSNNQFQGAIPEEVGELKTLIVLNFSHNSLTGPIPSSFGNLTALESLDLSSNKLAGEIPQELIALTFLEVLNLSYNQLVGPIPQGKQFNTFSNDSYKGNLGLCEFPMSKRCNSEPRQSQPPRLHEEEESTGWFDWKIALMGYGCGLVFGLSMGYIVFTTGKPGWFVRLVERKEIKKVRSPNSRHNGGRN